jgi:hypothetical protein
MNWVLRGFNIPVSRVMFNLANSVACQPAVSCYLPNSKESVPVMLRASARTSLLST